MKPIINNIRRAFDSTVNDKYDVLFEWSYDTPAHKQVIVQKDDSYILTKYTEDPLAEIEFGVGQSYIIEDAYELKKEDLSAKIKIYIITSVEEVTINDSIADWITNNQNLIVESNSVEVTALDLELKVIAEGNKLTTLSANEINGATLEFTGSIENQVDELLWYKVFLRDRQRQIVEHTEKIYLAPGAYSFTETLNHNFAFASETQYDLIILFSTKKGYVTLYSFPLFKEVIEGNKITLTIDSIVPKVETGSIDIQFSARTVDSSISSVNLEIARANAKDKYAHWETILRDTVEMTTDDAIYPPFKDTTIESGIGYKYKILLTYGNSSQVVVLNETPLFVFFDDILLSNENLQVRVAYNPDINGYKYILGDSITQTLGAPYPYFRRNGAMKYRQFNIGGLISYQAEADDISLLAADYDIDIQAYASLDYAARQIIYERLFREKVVAFLHSGDVMLFRSAPEGNIIVRLMNISLTPEKTLGRMLYSFTAQAIEVAEANLSNYKKYHLYQNKLLEIISAVYYNDYYIKGDVTNDTLIVNDTEIDDDSLIIHKESYLI